MRNIFITGGSKGIGLAMAIKYASDHNNRIIIVSRKLENLNEGKKIIQEKTKNNNIIIY